MGLCLLGESVHALILYEVALARLNDRQLRARPLVIASLETPRATLREVSRDAEDEGLHLGMSLDRAGSSPIIFYC